MKRLTITITGLLFIVIAGCEDQDALDMDAGPCDGSLSDRDGSDAEDEIWFDGSIDSGGIDAASVDWADASKPDDWPEGDDEFTAVDCDDDCSVEYTLFFFGSYALAESAFNVEHGTSGITAEEICRARDVLHFDMNSYIFFIYGQISHSILQLNNDWSLNSGYMTLTVSMEDTSSTRTIEFSYNKSKEQLEYSIASDNEKWEGSLKSSSAPIPMIGYEDYPIPTFGNYSPLFHMLVSRAYDWDKGGEQDIPVFLPETQRIINITAEKKSGDSLDIKYGEDVKWHDGFELFDGHGENYARVRFEQGTPTDITLRSTSPWKATGNGFEEEWNIPEQSEADLVTEPDLPDNFDEKNITVDPVDPDGGVTLEGTMSYPSGASNLPAVILSPGLSRMTRAGESRSVNVYEHLGANLASSGYVVVRYDNRGTGSSHGSYDDINIDFAAMDLESVIQHVAGLPETDDQKIFLLARREGSFSALKAASAGGVAGLIFVAPVADSMEEAEVYRNSAIYDMVAVDQGGVVVAEKMGSYTRKVLRDIKKGDFESASFGDLSTGAWSSLLDSDATTMLDAVAGIPMLIIRGSMDMDVPEEQTNLLASDARDAGITVSYKKLDDVSHDLTKATMSSETLWPEFGKPVTITSDAFSAMEKWLDKEVSK